MPARLALLVALTLVAAPLAAQAPATCEDAVVVLNTGWTYKQVTVTALPDAGLLEIGRPDGATLTVPMADVASVRDAAGNDVTAKLITGGMVAAAAETIAAAEPVAPPAESRPFVMSLGAGAGYGFPTGSFYDDMEQDWLFYGDLRAVMSPRNYLKFCFRQQTLFEGTLQFYDPAADISYSVDTTIKLRQYLVLVGFLAPPQKGRLVRGYAEIGAGLGAHVVTAASGGYQGDEKVNRFLLAGQAGALIPFNEDASVGLDVGVSFMAKIFDGDDGEGAGFIAAVQAGLVVLIGKES